MRACTVVVVSLLVARVAAADLVVVEHATLWVTPEEKLEHATLIVRDGVVLSAGRNVALPGGSNATIVDGRGCSDRRSSTTRPVRPGDRAGAPPWRKLASTPITRPAAFRIDWAQTPPRSSSLCRVRRDHSAIGPHMWPGGRRSPDLAPRGAIAPSGAR